MKFNIQKIVTLCLFCLATSMANAQITEAYVGQNYWYQLDNAWYRVEQLEPEIIRVGGIEFNSNYYGTNWYDKVLDQIESTGAVPMIQISEQWSSAQFNELMAHFKNTGRDIKYFSIGNEPDHNNRVSETQDIIDYYNDLGPKIRNYYPDCILIGPCWANFYDSFITSKYFPFIDGTKNTKDANGKYILNVFSFHTYASAFASNGNGIFDLATFKSRMNILLPKIAEVNATRPADEQLNWSVTEFHTTYNNTELNISGTIRPVPETHKTYGFYAGQYFAQLYGYAMEHKAFGMFPWSIYEGGGSRGDGDLGILDGDANFLPRSTFYHTQMLTQNLRTATIAHADTKNDVEIVSMQDNTGITVMVMNTQNNAYNLSLELDLTSTAPADLAITVDAGINKYISDTIEATTTKLYVFDVDGNLIQVSTYSKAHADSKSAPDVTLYDVNYVHAIPGKVEAEEFVDQVGLQTETVDPSEGTGENLAYTTAGDYAEYTIDVARSGEFQVDFRVASLNGGAGLSLSIDGVIVIPELTISSTGGWQNWETLTDTISLTQGEHTLRFDVITGGFNLNWIDFTFIPVVHQVEGLIEAEDYYQQLGLETETVAITEGTGENLAYTTAEDYANYLINVQQTGSYVVNFRVASLNGNASLSLSSDDNSILDSLPIASTGGWQIWETISDTVYLTAGQHTLQFDVLTAGFNLNWMEFIKIPATPPTIAFTKVIDGGEYTFGSDLNISVDASHFSGIANVKLYINDELLRQENQAPFDWGLGTLDPELNTLAPGTYFLKAVAEAVNGDLAETSITIHINVITGNSDPMENNNFSIYPNPVTNQLNLSMPTKWEIRNVLGERIMHGDDRVIYVAQLNPGTYFIVTSYSTIPFLKN